MRLVKKFIFGGGGGPIFFSNRNRQFIRFALRRFLMLLIILFKTSESFSYDEGTVIMLTHETIPFSGKLIEFFSDTATLQLSRI